jgi:pyruvate kinase
VRLVAKIERRNALDTLDAIAEAADALMVARGDLGVEVGVEDVPVQQHRIIAAGERHHAPVIVATEMLESMLTRERPTRAEASDVAHAVWDGAAALMLSAETAVGQFPVEAVATLDRIVRRAEAASDSELGRHPRP